MTDHELRLAARPETADDDPLVRTLMTHRLLGIVPDAAITVAVALMADNVVRHLPVMDGDRCVALVGETDLVSGLARTGLTVADVARPAPAVRPTDRRSTAAQAMAAAATDAVLVVDGDRLVGMVTATDLVRSLARDAPGTP